MNIPPGQGSLWPQLDFVEREEVQRILAPHNRLLWRVAHEPFDDWMHRRASDTGFHNWDAFDVAQWLHTQMRLRAEQIFRDHPDIRPRRLRSGLLILDCCERFAITIKKLRVPRCGPCAGEFCRSNYLTRTNQDYWDQRQCDEFPDYPRVILGYALEQEMTAIRVIIGYPRSRGLELYWYYFLPNEPQTGLWIPPASDPQDQPKPGFEILPDEDAEAEGDGS
jgi:hypothetical protein